MNVEVIKKSVVGFHENASKITAGRTATCEKG